MGGCASKCCCLMCVGQYDEYKVHQTGQAPSCWPCAATALYIPVPHSKNEKFLRADAKYLVESMKGCGTKDGALGRLVATRTMGQLKAIKEVFDGEFGNHDTVEQWIKDDTSGDWRKVLLMAFKPRGDRLAEIVHETMAGIGTADDELRELMTTFSASAMEECKEAYQRLFNRTLAGDIRDDTSFNYKATLLALQDRAGYLAKQCHDAIAGVGTDDIRLIRVLCSHVRSYGTLRRLAGEFEDLFNDGLLDELEYELSMPDLQDIKRAYERLFHKSLVTDVANDTTGQYRRTLLTLLQPPEETLADAFNLALEGKGTNDELLIEVATCSSNRRLLEAAQVYQRKYGRPLKDAVKADTSGDYELTIISCLSPRSVQYAWSLHDSMAGLGTDDTRLMNILCNKSRREIRGMAIAYQKKYGKSLEDEIRSETSYWYRRFLVYIVRQAFEDVIWVPDDQLTRIRDF